MTCRLSATPQFPKFVHLPCRVATLTLRFYDFDCEPRTLKELAVDFVASVISPVCFDLVNFADNALLEFRPLRVLGPLVSQHPVDMTSNQVGTFEVNLPKRLSQALPQIDGISIEAGVVLGHENQAFTASTRIGLFANEADALGDQEVREG